MSDWKIGLNPAPPGGSGYWVVDVMNAQMAWKRLSKPARQAVSNAWNLNILVYGHRNTLHALYRHGFITYDERGWGVLTDAGKAVARWCVRGEAA